MPVLEGCSAPGLPFEPRRLKRQGEWRIWEGDSVIHAVCETPAVGPLAPIARRLYREAFEIADGLHLYRFWNFVPGINKSTNDLENYRSFGAGRYEAFGERFGLTASTRMPAASAVGTDGHRLVVCMMAGKAEPIHFENPEQTPAYRYPDTFGPRPPSFSRASRVTLSNRTVSFIAGTAAIRGFDSVGLGDQGFQIDVILKNLEMLGKRMDLPPALGRNADFRRAFRIYLRNEADLSEARDRFNQSLIGPEDETVWLRSDICRRDLDIEVEAALIEQ